MFCHNWCIMRSIHCTDIILNFLFRFYPLHQYFKSSLMTTTVTVTTPCMSCLVGDAGSPHSRATVAVQRNRCGGVSINTSLLISLNPFFCAACQNDLDHHRRSGTITIYDCNQLFFHYDLLKFAFILNQDYHFGEFR